MLPVTTRLLLITRRGWPNRKALTSLIWMGICLALGAGMVGYPATVIAAARRGLQTWWEIVLPSLLPFFIIAELLMSLGFVTMLGRLLEPAMRPLFRLPGSGGFILGVSYISGFPLCALLTARLRRAGLCTREEGERLVAFTSNASPLFMLGAVSVGMLGNPDLGPGIALIHYFSNLCCGLILKFFYRETLTRRKTVTMHTVGNTLIGNSLEGFGARLGETVRNATTTLLAIGGFITLFSVLIGILQAAGIFPLLLRLLDPLTDTLNIDPSLIRSLLYGFFEMTLGVNEVSQSAGSLLQKLIIIEIILAWNGLAVHAQVAGMMLGSDLAVLPYFVTRLLQVPLAALLTWFCFPLIIGHTATTATRQPLAPPLWSNLLLTLGLIFLILLLLVLLHTTGRGLWELCRKNIMIIR